jgi:dTDP-4-amino-4,6-dideoxygalactose transaminase
LWLAARGIGTLVQWGGLAVHENEALGFNCRLPATEARFRRMLMLPMNTSVANEDVDYVCEQVRAFYGRA